ncbi:MAG: hypothetical protein BWX64_00830 [Acidobacteria bacterium ADurb.Bin051]|nr:MAG: hypothetical protein BWX64_00830 [Acidobacteria bacterium ADurb.Bin051]
MYDPRVRERSHPSGARRPVLGALLVWGAIALLALLAQKVLAPWLARERGGLGEAHWLWAPEDPRGTAPTAFFLVRDFSLETPPAGAARLIASGDEEYSVFLNGAWVAAGRYHPGAPAEVRDLTGILRPGENRLVVELRSSHGLGGFAARLADGADRTLLLTDASWEVVRADWGLLTDGVREPGAAPRDWGVSPVGRWQRLSPGPVRPPLAGEREELAARWFTSLPQGEWFPAPQSAYPAFPLGRKVIFDWGKPVEGFLALEFATGEGGGRTLVTFAEELTDEVRPRADRLFVRPPGRNYWYDVEPHRFRYATVVTLDPVLAAKVYLEPVGAPPPEPPPGWFGVRLPPLRPPGEDELWRELEGVPDGAGGEAGERLPGLGGEAPG